MNKVNSCQTRDSGHEIGITHRKQIKKIQSPIFNKLNVE